MRVVPRLRSRDARRTLGGGVVLRRMGCFSTWHFLGTHVIGGKVWELTRRTDHADDLQTVK